MRPGDEAFATLTQFARAQDLEAAQITAVGAFSHATVGWFDREAPAELRKVMNPDIGIALIDLDRSES